ncbi:secretion-regulating guanine nucleotide exchange factor [Brienomyrus brachyistius]|uniref:secretion-regulating guanine nucleotide exchange factor n=1 Tax=Brienomyrus brachyistius TaxID=42636 RepID=UPI0020B354D6|nr:secretion-regulating guanine nucleotide exchange factor [Brienomyrus brachyistius]
MRDSGSDVLDVTLFTWGANSYGQLSQGHVEDRCEPGAAECALPTAGARSLRGGGGHAALVTESGQLMVCGQNHRGQLGLGHTSQVTAFIPCLSLGLRSVSQVSCGWDFTLILTDCGQLLACGSNAHGQLGLPQVSGYTAKPLPIEALISPIISVAAGLRHSLAVDSSGCVYQWGVGLSSEARRLLAPQAVPAHLTSREPCAVPALDTVSPKSVTAGASHCVCLTAGGDVFLWGSNKQGQLGGLGPFQSLPRVLDRILLAGESVTDVWSGWTHLVARTESGRVFTWGRGDYGQLGRALQTNQDLSLLSDDPPPAYSRPMACHPVEVKALAGATQVACGSEHSLAVVGGALVSWGWNEHGMCGDGTRQDVSSPAPIAALRLVTPVLIGCGAGHSMALCAVPLAGSTEAPPWASSSPAT